VADVAAARRETPNKIRDLIHAARVRGLLSKGSRGQLGGMLTARGRAIARPRKAPLRAMKGGRRAARKR
jgi:hypothetical protein